MHNSYWRIPVRNRLPDYSRKALRTLPALEHGTELGVCHSQHIHGEEIAIYAGVRA